MGYHQFGGFKYCEHAMGVDVRPAHSQRIRLAGTIKCEPIGLASVLVPHPSKLLFSKAALTICVCPPLQTHKSPYTPSAPCAVSHAGKRHQSSIQFGEESAASAEESAEGGSLKHSTLFGNPSQVPPSGLWGSAAALRAKSKHPKDGLSLLVRHDWESPTSCFAR